MSKNQNRGLKLRQTHYILGKDDPNYLSEYNNEYIPKKASLLDNNQLGRYLRNSNFVLGNTPLNYETSQDAQSASIPKKIKFKFDDENKENKIKLQRTNFILGNEKNDFVTKYNSEYFNKLPFIKDKNNRKNTAELQKSHLSLGSQDIPWLSTNRYFLTPKANVDFNNRYNNDSAIKLRQSNIVFSQEKDNNNFITENMESFCPIPSNFEQNKMDTELKNNLRREHFNFGNEDNPNNRISLNQINFRDPKLHKNFRPINYKNNIDINKFRRSNWSISNGDERNFFQSSYGLAMTPKKPEIKEKKEVNTFKSSVIIGGGENQKDTYMSEYRKNYLDGKLGINLKSLSQDKKLLDTINNIRKSHFNFGESKIDYLSTNNNDYKYDPVLAKEGRGKLNDILKNNLRSSHYELGMGNEREKYTSNRRDYISYPNFRPEKKIEKNLESSVFHRNTNEFKGESIYMSDYTEKPIPNPDDNLPDFL